MKSIDWLMAYATGAVPWPHKQPKKPVWDSMKSPLRRAARHYKDEKYEKALCTILKAEGKARYYERALLNLQLPPLAPAECSQGASGE